MGYGPSVKDGEVLYSSPSATSTAKRCLRKWFYEKILKIRPEQKTSAKAGDLIHNRIAHYLTTGEEVLTRIELAAKPFMPTPQTSDYEIEKELKWDYPLANDGVPYVGKMDVVNRSGYFVHPALMKPFKDLRAKAEVIDWKTHGDMKWAKRPYTIQMDTYGLAICRNLELDKVRLSHVCINRSKPQAIKLTRVARRERLEKAWEGLVPTVRSMKDAAKETDPNVIDYNLEACGDYGGCPHAAYCSATKEKTLTDFFGERGAMSLLNLKTENEKEETTITLPDMFAEAIAAIEDADMGFPKLEGDVAEYVCSMKGEPLTDTREGYGRLGAVTLVSVDNIFKACSELAGQGKCTWPPEKPQEAPANDTMGLLPDDAPASDPAKASEKPAEEEEEEQAPAKTEEVPQAFTEKDLKKMKKGELVKLVLDIQTQGTVTAPVTPAPAAQPEGFTLYVNAVPHCAYESLAPWVDAVCANLAGFLGVKDIRLGGEKGDFGKWKGALAALARETFQKKPLKGCYFLHADSEINSIVADALRPMGSYVRGI